jgi:hypothetical protein
MTENQLNSNQRSFTWIFDVIASGMLSEDDRFAILAARVKKDENK